MGTKKQYNKRYSRKELYWGKKPSEIVEKSIKYLIPDSKVLDLGCGEGGNALYLSKNNFRTTAVDFSKEGIKKMTSIAKKNKLKIKTSNSNIKNFLRWPGKYEGIFCINALQFIGQKSIHKTIKRIKNKTSPGGINVITSFVAENKKQKELAIFKNRYRFDKGELKKFYKDWEVILYMEKLGKWETHGAPRHRHYYVKMIARKPMV